MLYRIAWLRDLPIRHKVTFITMVTSVLALLVASVAFVAYEHASFRDVTLTDVETTAAVVADGSSAALTFNDPASATQTLKSLSVHRHIVGAAIYGPKGEVFATYQRPGAVPFHAPRFEAEGYWFGAEALSLFRPITLAGERVGTVYLQSDLSEMHARVRRYEVTMLLIVAGALAIAWLLAARLQRVISRPVAHLAAAVTLVTTEKNYGVRAIKAGDDELGRLIDGFNAMLGQIQAQDAALNEARDKLERRVEARTQELKAEIAERTHAQAELERVHGQLLDASRQAGMAEIATNVLHNVGNVLNSVNVSAILVSDLAQKSSAQGLGRVVALIHEHQSDLGTFITTDVRGKHLLPHLNNLAQHLAAEQSTIVRELDSLRTNIEHIKDIVSMQQSYAKVGGANEIIGAVDLLEDALRINAGALIRHEVEVERDFDGEPMLNVDKHKVLQILVNLIRNAKYACEESGQPHRRITLRLRRSEGRVRIAVMDNGVGIAPENLTRIFNHGFTTRATGHGFGLHSGALAARELGGSLTVRSDGPGLGAIFTLELPEHAMELAHA